MSGVAILGLGWRHIRCSLQHVRQASRTVSRVQAGMPDGWGSWFFTGCSTAATGTGLVVSSVRAAALAVLGIVVVSIGFWVVR